MWGHFILSKGKKMELSLREKEKQLEQDMFNGLVPGGGGTYSS